MKTSTCGCLGLLVASAVVLGGCAGTEKLVITGPVGPYPPVVRPPATEGNLIVYSGWDRLDTLDAEHPKHTPYLICTENGKPLQHVRNRHGSFEADPEVVSLAPGRYWIEAEGTNIGLVKIAAVIEDGQTTRIFLDATTEPVGPWEDGTNWITEPNGLVVGWRDQAALPPTGKANFSP